MIKYLFSISIFFAASIAIAQQTKMNFYLLNQINNNPTKEFNTLIKANPKTIEYIAKQYKLSIVHSSDGIYSVKGTGKDLLLAAKDNCIQRIEYFKNNLQILDDSSLVKNNVLPVHSGVSPLASAGYKGKNVIIGIIDTGIDYGHPDFKDSLGHTRLKYIWDQSSATAANTPQPYNYGQEWDSTGIEQGIATTPVSTYGGHGTKVTGVAAGNGRTAHKYRGIAPEADIIFVAIDFNNTTNPTIADAVHYIYEKANQLSKSCVINISLGDNYGSHDGKDLQAQYLNSLITAQSGRALVAANGNSGNVAFHLGYISTINDTSFTWLSNASNQLIFDVYADSADFKNLKLSVGVTSPSFQNKTNFGFRSVDSSLGVVVYDTLRFGGNKIGDILTYTDYSNGVYTFSCMINADSLNYLWSFETAGAGKIDSWNFDWKSSALPSTSTFPHIIKYKRPDTLQTMCSSFQCSDEVLSIGNYVGRNSYYDVRDTLYFFPGVVDSIFETSSLGPTRDLRTKPDICATGENIVTVGERGFLQWLITNYPFIVTRDSMHMIFGGSSAASPVVAGLAALYFEAHPTATNQMLKQDIINCAKADTFTRAVPNNLWGNGKLDGFGALTCSMSNNIASYPQSKDALDFFPNPFENEFTIKLNSNFSGTLKLTDVSGRCIYSKEINLKSGIEYKQKLPAIVQGVYVLSFESNNQSYKKLIVKN